MYLLAAITLGFLGSLHCIGMCGPIALALPVNTQTLLGRIWGILAYNKGRIITYGLLGGLFGLIGQSFFIGGYQQYLSIALGILLLTSVLMPEHVAARFRITKMIYSVIGGIKSKLGALFQKKNLFALFAIGILNGLLPCGLIYTAAAGAIATGNSLDGALFMMVFGLGTLPAMFAMSFFKTNIPMVWRKNLLKAVPVFIGIMAVLLILRGLNLGIPYISPKISATECHTMTCCHNK